MVQKFIWRAITNTPNTHEGDLTQTIAQKLHVLVNFQELKQPQAQKLLT